MRLARSWLGALGAVFWCARPSVAQTTEPAANLVSLAWVTPEACPSGAEVSQRVRELAGVFERREPLRASGQVTATAGGVRLHLETRDAGQTFVRDVDLPTCAEAAETAALILAMALRAETAGGDGKANPLEPGLSAPSEALSAALPPGLPEVPTPGNETPPTVPEPQRASAPSGVSRSLPDASTERPDVAATEPALTRVPNKKAEGNPTPSRYPWSLGGGGNVAWAVLPKALWSGGLWGGVTFDGWRFEVAAAIAPPRRVSLANDATRGGEFVAWSIGVRGCYVAAGSGPEAIVRGLVCAGAEGGQLRARGFGTALREQGVSPWWALDAGLGGLVRIASQVTGVLRVELVAPLWRDSFVLRSPGVSDGRVAQSSPVVGRLGLGVEVAF